MTIIEASKNLLEACYQADARNDLPVEITGELIDAMRDALLRAVEIPHLELLNVDREIGRHCYRVDKHVNPEGPAECRKLGGRCALIEREGEHALH